MSSENNFERLLKISAEAPKAKLQLSARILGPNFDPTPGYNHYFLANRTGILTFEGTAHDIVTGI